MSHADRKRWRVLLMIARGHSYTEVGCVMNLTRGQVSGIWFRARQKHAAHVQARAKRLMCSVAIAA